MEKSKQSIKTSKGITLGKYKGVIFDSETPEGINGIKNLRQKNSKNLLIFASGCFDVAHSGHPLFAEQMRLVGNNLAKKGQKVIVVIGLGKDSVLRKLKGVTRPVNPELNRAYLLASYKDVDHVILDATEVGEDKIDFGETLRILKPNVFVLNDDDSSMDIKKKLCKSLGITFKTVKRIVPNFLKPMSSTQIIREISK